MQQHTPEWHAARLGKLTASRIHEATTKSARSCSGYLAARENYKAELICERLTGRPYGGLNTPAMQHGTDTEPQARAAYMLETGNDVAETGFIPHPGIAMSGASPDGLIGADGLIEIKCPNTATHIDFLRSGRPKPQYLAQMQWQMACTGRQWCDFVSYDPRLPETLAIRIKRIERDNDTIARLEAEAEKFLNETAAETEYLQNL
ncbi:putative phage-type endonuclease [Kingella potus]|uniref:Putative phage-type endonuclease n=2 Tax=Kingella potus TaxID=265175 RepID=A0A377R276_9NEIS|nr:lambda exonuclease family protein [Kingella potus]UOP00570.1 YqaJ viral recombinase family protein [Kingella potus]UOP02052.1 YqaJ viral recombinase family protein [Kingella potus]STR03038.1 putative phage-type endonuclease [Kingella potus]STR03073.1 putative phage-type endonuclease [Kingella potus]